MWYEIAQGSHTIPTKRKGGNLMHHENHARNQCIHCSVSSCKYHQSAKNLCSLESISVQPSSHVNSGKTDESMCGSYHQ